MSATYNLPDRISGCILGTAVGDALGLPFEGLTAARRARMFGPVEGYRFILRSGMVSDDTEHACMTAQCLIESGGDCERFQRSFAWRLRWWFLMFPAGVGLATLRACVKLWVGFPPERSGVYSAGNGPAMRSPVIGAALGAEDPRLRSLVEASTQITHRDPKAFCGAYAAALAAAWAAEALNPALFPDALAERLTGEAGAEALLDRIQSAWRSASAGESTRMFADELGLTKGVTGYIYDTVPVAIHGWMRHPTDFASAVIGVIECGGDSDSTGALVGAITGAQVGASNIPDGLLNGLVEWPRTVEWMRRLGSILAEHQPETGCGVPPRLNPAMVLARNIFFTAIVLAHGFRRLVPPY